MDNRDSRFNAEPRRSMCAVDVVVVFVVFVVAVIFAFVFFAAFFAVFLVFFRPLVCVLSRAISMVLRIDGLVALLGRLLDALLDVWCSPDPPPDPPDPHDPSDVLAPEEQGSRFDSFV